MKIAVLSCIHGNLPALDAVLVDIREQEVDQIFCVGDLVGYGPFPNEVVERIRQLQIPTCAGCWDEDVVEGHNACECSYPSLLAEKRGLIAHEWTNRVVTSENRDYLAQLPHSLRYENLCFVHGSPNSAHEYLLPNMDRFMALERVFSTGADVLFCGHTHIPYVRVLDQAQIQIHINEINQVGSQKIHQTHNIPMKQIINVGSVGEPRHGRPHATYVIYDDQTQKVSLREIPYNVSFTSMAILEKGLPAIFAWRLARGLEFAERADDPAHVCTRS
ncbi:MAG: metallophosphoesterase family protein [Synechococcaceae cyanobacterium SM2_3_1]|nr:metallophosphoesterase family protein [Synechococcaceae cyanobacterium SM2_3_1]